jgi:hypothetical protein
VGPGPQIAPPRYPVWKHAAILLIVGIFALLGVRRALDNDGDDLSASFIGCRLIATHQTAHLYAHDPRSFAEIGPDAPWQEAADDGHYRAFLHPYVQTPLWAWSLQPVCRAAKDGFPTFQNIFAVLTLLSFAACIGLVAFFWSPELYNPIPVALICLVLWFAEPFQYALALMQTHVLFLLLTLAALILAERKRPIPAGVLLALAAAVKITPGALVLYWLLTRRYKAAASMAVTSVLLWAAAYLAVGRQVMADYRATLDRVSHVLLLSQNNQSFAAWLMSRSYPAREMLVFNIFPLPTWVRLLSTALFVACTAMGGLMDRGTGDRSRSTSVPTRMPAPLGAMFALVSATIFAPISWTHYSIILLAPLMALLHEQAILLRTRPPRLNSWLAPRWIAPLVLVIAALNFQPFAAGAVDTVIHTLTLVRSHFYSEVLCLLTLAAAWHTRRSNLQSSPAAPTQAREQVYS